MGDHEDVPRRAGRPSRDSPLLRAKLRPPQPPDHAIARPRLLQLLDDAASAPLILVVAPAGAGKSVLLGSWVSHRSDRSAWLSIDEGDRDPAQFWTGVLAAVDILAPGRTDEARQLLRRKRPAAEVVAQVLNDLDDAQVEPHHLVLDDLHLVDDRTDLAASIDLFLQHLPAWLHVLAGSRRDPHLPVDRLRARGQLGEVRFAELRFSAEEATALLAGLAPSMAPERVEETVAGTAGWAAGLQLAALADRSAAAQGDATPPGLAGTVLVDDFVWREVLVNERDELVELLLDVSVVERLNGALATALWGRADAGELLAQAAARGLFVGRLGADGWFEVHALVRTALLAELDRRAPARRCEQHARAAAWFEDHDEVAAALDQWQLAGHHRNALRLLADQHARLYDEGREATLHRGLDAIPPEVTVADFEALLEYAWCHLLVSRRGFIDTVDHAVWWAARSDVDPRLRHRLTMLQAVVCVVQANWHEAARLARSALDAMGDSWRRDQVGRVGWNLVARDIALSERWCEGGEEISEAEHALQLDAQRRLAFEGTRAIGQALAGRPVEALQDIAGIRHAADVTNMTIVRAELGIAEAIAHRELGDRTRALAELRVVADMPAETMVYCKLLALVVLVRSHLDEGDVEQARTALGDAESIVVMESIGAGGQDWVAQAAAELARRTDDADGARRRAVQIADPFWRSIASARLDLDADDPAAARLALEEAEPRCVRHEVVLDLVRARAAVDPHEAAKWVASGLEVAARHELLQTVVDEGREIADLLEREAGRVPEAWMHRLRRLLALESDRGPRSRRLDSLEPLTEREREVLRFLPSRLTTREIADELYVSVNTLKFHLKVIYRKLGVTSRAEAAEQARRMSSG